MTNSISRGRFLFLDFQPLTRSLIFLPSLLLTAQHHRRLLVSNSLCYEAQVSVIMGPVCFSVIYNYVDRTVSIICFPAVIIFELNRDIQK